MFLARPKCRKTVALFFITLHQCDHSLQSQRVVIERPLNKFQANKSKGREREVDGFYKSDAGDFLIDRLTTKGTELGASNASQKWNVETLKLAGDEFISVNIRQYHIDTYTRLK